MAKRKRKADQLVPAGGADYEGLLSGLSALLDQSRRSAARAVNAVLTATYWEVGRRVVEFEQGGRERAGYGEALMAKLAADLSGRYGRGFSRRNLEQMRVFYLGWEMQPVGAGALQARAKGGPAEKAQTPSAELLAAGPGYVTAALFPLPWSHYARLMTVPNLTARRFYEEEAIKGGWSVRQLDRQIGTQFFERLRGSDRKDSLLAKAHVPTAADAVAADELVRDPYVLEVRHDNREGIADPVSRTLGRRCLSRPTYSASKDGGEHSLLVKRRWATKCPDLRAARLARNGEGYTA